MSRGREADESAAAARLLDLVELGEQESGVGDGIDADIVAAPVRGAAGELQSPSTRTPDAPGRSRAWSAR